MASSRDIAALSVSFTAGIAGGMFLVALIGGSPHPVRIYAAAEMAFVAAASALAWLISHKRHHTAEIVILYIFTGALCAVAGDICGIGAARDGDFIGHTAAAAVKSWIDDIPFRHESTAGLVKALITGDKSGLDRSVIMAFRESGASHILALSGLHLGIIYAILLRLTSFIGKSPAARKARSIIIIATSGFYTLATGACESLVRAFLFILLNESARLLYRRTSPARVFCAALMIQLAIKPSSITSIGFQLSYMAMAGIFFLLPVMKSWYPEGHDSPPGKAAVFSFPRKIWDAAAMTIACQIFTGPLAWLHFRTFPTYFLITNLLALPVTSIMMTVAVATVLLYGLGVCPGFMIRATDQSAGLLIFIMNVVAGM